METYFANNYIVDRCQELEFYIEMVVLHVCLRVVRSLGWIKLTRPFRLSRSFVSSSGSLYFLFLNISDCMKFDVFYFRPICFEYSQLRSHDVETKLSSMMSGHPIFLVVFGKTNLSLRKEFIRNSGNEGRHCTNVGRRVVEVFHGITPKGNPVQRY